MTNLNDLAKTITLKEGKKVDISIAQVKELLNIIFTDYDLETIIKIYFKYNKK